MIKNIAIGQYFPGDTLIHRLDPRVKILLSMLFIVAIFFVESFLPYLFILGFILTIIKVSEIPIKFILKGLRPLFFIIILTFGINLFMTRGEVLVKIGFLSITKEGLHQAVFMALRLIFLVTGTSLLTLTTSPITLTDGIEELLNPFRKIGVPAHELAMMMTIALRFIPTLIEETDKIMKAQMARGADFESGNLVQRAKSLVPLLVPLFINSFRRADELALAMEARCYRGGENRTKFRELKINKTDIIVFVGVVIFYIAIAMMRFL